MWIAQNTSGLKGHIPYECVGTEEELLARSVLVGGARGGPFRGEILFSGAKKFYFQPEPLCLFRSHLPPNRTAVSELVENATVEAVDIDFYDVRVEVSQLPRWAIEWQLGPKRRVREGASLDGKLVVASEPSLILIPAEHKEALLAALRQVDCLVAPGFTADCLAARGVHICVLKLMEAYCAIGIEHERVLGYGQRQPRAPFLDILPIAPYIRQKGVEVGPGASVDIFAGENSYDISLTIQTPGVVHILDAATRRLNEGVDDTVALGLLDLVAQQQSDPGSVLHAVKRLKLTVFPMFSDLGKDEKGDGPAFGSMRIEPVYDKHSWKRLSSVLTPSSPPSVSSAHSFWHSLSGGGLPLEIQPPLCFWNRPLGEDLPELRVAVFATDLQDHQTPAGESNPRVAGPDEAERRGALLFPLGASHCDSQPRRPGGARHASAGHVLHHWTQPPARRLPG